MPAYKILFAVLAAMIFGLNAVLSKIGLAEFPPLFFNLLRFLLILPFVAFIKRPNISWSMLLAIGGSLGVVQLSLANVGMAMGASAGMYVLLLQTGSLFVMLFAYLFFGSKPTRYDLIGVALGLMGVFIICTANGTQGGPIAIAALIGSAMAWGLGFTLVKKVQAPSVPTTVWMSLFTVPFLMASTGFVEGGEAISEAVQKASWVGWSTVAFSSIASMLIGGGLLMYLMRTEPVAKVAPYNLLTPVFGCLFSFVILGETLSLQVLFGGIWILSGLIISQFGSRLYPMLSGINPFRSRISLEMDRG